MESSWKYRFLVRLCLRLRLSIALKRGYAVTTFKVSNDAMAPELRSGDIVAVDTRSAGQQVSAGDLVVASIKSASWDTASDNGSPTDEESESSGEEERRLVARKVAAVAGDAIPCDVLGAAAVVPEGCVYLLASDRSKGPDSGTSDIGPRPLTDILGKVVAVRRGRRITWY
jgi:hypothetical protein